MELKPRKIWTIAVFFTQEDEYLFGLASACEDKDWVHISGKMVEHFGPNARSAKQCRERWINILDPKNSETNWTLEEDKILFAKHATFGNSWSKIARFINGRSSNAIKNRFYCIVRKNLRRYNKSQPPEKRISGKIYLLIKKKAVKKLIVKLPEKKQFRLNQRQYRMITEMEKKYQSQLDEEVMHGQEEAAGKQKGFFDDPQTFDAYFKLSHFSANENTSSMIRKSGDLERIENEFNDSRIKKEKMNTDNETFTSIGEGKMETVTSEEKYLGEMGKEINQSLLNHQFFYEIIQQTSSFRLPDIDFTA